VLPLRRYAVVLSMLKSRTLSRLRRATQASGSAGPSAGT
jgi:hypothetical protein